MANIDKSSPLPEKTQIQEVHSSKGAITDPEVYAPTIHEGTILHDDAAQVSSPCKTRLGVDKPSEVVQEKANDAKKNQEDQARTNHEEAFEPTKVIA
ncbi:hypothetical protein GOBAR_AA30207 [Gossypium barbadense]|uniref:Uncharacterized protein n=1 Tax=Gossypium barbadense TaxID=3634 RepID=A0A2P5WHB4_GOSBA|nr:hypothetical protein GOBAR_AA30207 [Gossypium barbadense]